MKTVSVDDAITIARRKIGLDDSVRARAWPTRRLDLPDHTYYLVIFGEDDAAVGLACVNAENGGIESFARLPGITPHRIIDEAHAIKLAGGDGQTPARMVWKPSRATRSPLYPLWEVDNGTERVFVDQQGSLWHESDLVDSMG